VPPIGLDDRSDAIHTTPSDPNRHVVVTGAASGIGRATARAFAGEGATLHLVDIDMDGLEATSANIAELGAGSVRVYEVDVSSNSAVGQLARELSLLGEPLEVVANIAGIGVRANAVETTQSDWDRVIAVNLTGTFLMCKHLIPLMAPNGVIVNVASVAGLVGIENRAAYCASKAGIVGLTKSIAVDYGPEGIRAVALCPGTVETEWIDRILDGVPDRKAARASMEARQLDGRLGQPEDIAATIAFVASESGRFFNGSALVIDGGMTA
jgi:NAD(P)-dependent dehydrogenase (short-subunit alcohol dehydrogenase family)